MNNDNSGDEDSSSNSSMILELLKCQNEPISIALEIPDEEGSLDDPLPLVKAVSSKAPFLSEIPTGSNRFYTR